MLRWSIDNIRDYKALWNYDGTKPESEQYILNNCTESMIYMTIAVGMSNITEKNHLDFWSRLRIMGLDDNHSYQDVKRHIGLTTNATPLTKAKFLKHAYDKIYEEALYEKEKADG
tara:strand:+ start:645 stop:989 length:345 start_codon:yes stop_codon:yes gene_type:complete